MKSLSRLQLDSLLQVARKHGEREYLMLLVGFNHALRASELLSLTKNNLVDGFLIVQRLKGSKRTVQPLLPNEREGLLELAQNAGRFFPICRKTLWARIQQYGKEAGIPEFLCHPHVLRHTCAMLGLAGGMPINAVQNYLGHRNGQNTLLYLEVDDDIASRAFAAAIGA